MHLSIKLEEQEHKAILHLILYVLSSDFLLGSNQIVDLEYVFVLSLTMLHRFSLTQMNQLQILEENLLIMCVNFP